jgi:hypothetical protein
MGKQIRRIAGGVCALLALAACGEQTPYERKMSTCSPKGEALAAVMAQGGVRQALRSPSTASFPSSGMASHNGDCTFNVSGRVDAQNGFGAVERRFYTGIIKYDHNSDTWRMQSVDLGE